MMRSVFGWPRRSGLVAGGLWIGIYASACQMLSGIGAKPPTVDECATADETAQALRKNGNLPRGQAATCRVRQQRLPGAGARRLHGEGRPKSTRRCRRFLFDVKDELRNRRHRRRRRSWTTWRSPITSTSTAFAVDPGKHRFTFTAANGRCGPEGSRRPRGRERPVRHGGVRAAASAVVAEVLILAAFGADAGASRTSPPPNR